MVMQVNVVESPTFAYITAGAEDAVGGTGQTISIYYKNFMHVPNELWSFGLIKKQCLKFECMALMSSASLLATFGPFIRCKDGKVKKGMAVDA